MKAERIEVPLSKRLCTICGKEVPAERVPRHSPFCCEDCRKVDKNERRAVMAGKKCRLCKRRFPKPRIPKVKEETPELFEACAPGAQAAAEASATPENA